MRPRLAQLRQPGVTDGQVVTWDAGLGRFIAADPAGGSMALDDLTDVDTTTTPPADGQTLVFDSGSSLWVPGDGPAAPNGLPTGGSTGQVLTKDSGTDYDATWHTPSGGGGSVTALSDTFNRANGAVGAADGGILNQWGIVAGSWAISGNALTNGADAGAERYIMAHGGWQAAGKVRTFVWTLKTKPAAGDGGLMWRCEGTPNGLLLNVEATYKLYRKTGSGYTAVTATSGTPVAPVAGDVITVVDEGVRVTVTVNGGAAVVYDVVYYLGGYIGFRNAGGTGMTHESIVVTDA